MKLVILLLVCGCASVLAQDSDFEGSDLHNISGEDDLEELLSSGQLNKTDEEAIRQTAISLLSTGRPNCFPRSNWNKRFRHNWYTSRFWECNRWRTDLRTCAIPRLYQPSLERCVWPWNWRWESIHSNDLSITNETRTTTDTVPETTSTTPAWPPTTTPPPAVVSKCDEPVCDGGLSEYLQPAHEPNQFYQCTIMGKYLVLNCPGSLVFNYPRQMCLPISQWVNSC